MTDSRKKSFKVGSILSVFGVTILSGAIWMLDMRIGMVTSAAYEARITPIEEAITKSLPRADFDKWADIHRDDVKDSARKTEEVLKRIEALCDRMSDEINLLNRKVDVIQSKVAAPH